MDFVRCNGSNLIMVPSSLAKCSPAPLRVFLPFDLFCACLGVAKLPRACFNPQPATYGLFCVQTFFFLAADLGALLPPHVLVLAANLPSECAIDRDLKAENLLLDSQLGIKLIDFGLSNRWAPGELLKTFCGSPTYTAPELIKRQQYEGPEVDLWSLGVLLYVLVCGSLPFDGNTFQELFTKIINGQYIVPDHVSSECRDLIGRMLVVNPKQRATLDQVREHPWTREGGRAVPKASIGKLQVPISEQDMDHEVLDELVHIGFEKEYAIQAVLSNSYDDAAATYYLLVEAKKRRAPTPTGGNASNASRPNNAQQVPQQQVAVTQPQQRSGSHQFHGQGYVSAQPVPQRPLPTQPMTVQSSQYQQQGQQGQQLSQHGGHQPTYGYPSPAATPQLTISPSSPPVPHAGSGTSGYVPTSPQTSRTKVPTFGPNGAPHYNGNPAYSGGNPAYSGNPAYANNNAGYSGNPAYAESGNPAYRGQPPKRRERPGSKGHRRHHTVGTPGEFPVEEEEDAPQTVSPSNHAAYPGTNAYQPMGGGGGVTGYLVSQAAASGAHTGGHQLNESGGIPIPRSGSIPHNPTQYSSSRPKSPRKGSTGEDSSMDLSDQLSTISVSPPSSLTSSGSISKSTSSSRSKHTRMPSNPPPIEEEEEMFYPPVMQLSSASSSSSKANRPTGGIQPRSATLRTEKTRHKDHSRPVTSGKKKSHSRRTSFDPDEPTETTPLASSSKDIKRSSDKRVQAQAATPTSGNVISPRGRKSSKGGNGLHSSGGASGLSSSPGSTVVGSPPHDEDSTLVSLNPSTPPHSPSSSRVTSSAYTPTQDNTASTPNGSANGTTKPSSTKKESRSIVTRFKGLFSRKQGPEPRQVRFSINENNTTHEAPEVVLGRIVEVLKSLDLPHSHFLSPFCIKTEAVETGVALEVEICQLPIIHLIGVRFRRICGDAWQYTRICKKILDLLDLNNSASKSASSPSAGPSRTNNLTSSSSHSSSNTTQNQAGSFAISSANSAAAGNLHSGSSVSLQASTVSLYHSPIPQPSTTSVPNSAYMSPAQPNSSSTSPSSNLSANSAVAVETSSSKKNKRMSDREKEKEKDKDKKKDKHKDKHAFAMDDSSLSSPSKRTSFDLDIGSSSSSKANAYKDESPRKALTNSRIVRLPTLDDEESSGSYMS